MRRAAWEPAGGFDERFHPAYYVDVDFAMALRASWPDVLCEPASGCGIERGGTSGAVFSAFVPHARNRERFCAKWAADLTHQELAGSVDALARAFRATERRPRPSLSRGPRARAAAPDAAGGGGRAVTLRRDRALLLRDIEVKDAFTRTPSASSTRRQPGVNGSRRRRAQARVALAELHEARRRTLPRVRARASTPRARRLRPGRRPPTPSCGGSGNVPERSPRSRPAGGGVSALGFPRCARWRPVAQRCPAHLLSTVEPWTCRPVADDARIRTRYELADDGRPRGARRRAHGRRAGRRLATGIEGVVYSRAVSHVDHRGSLTEAVNFDDPFWDEPIVYSYCFTIRPGRIKGWGMHRKQADRYFLAHGNVRVVLFDGRVASPTHGTFAQFHLTDAVARAAADPARRVARRPELGRHGGRAVNFPTRAFDREQPDKHRIDPASGEIPFDFTLPDG